MYPVSGIYAGPMIYLILDLISGQIREYLKAVNKGWRAIHNVIMTIIVPGREPVFCAIIIGKVK